MNARFFKKFSPAVPFYLSNGSALHFDRVNHDVGILMVNADNHPGVIAEIEAAQRDGRGGIVEIPEAEFRALSQKKTMTSAPAWREEFGKSAVKAPRLVENHFVSHAEDESPAQAAVSVTQVPVAAAEAPAPPAPGKRASRPVSTKRA